MKFRKWVFLISPVVLFYFFVVYYSINVGWNDDWHGLEGFLASWMQQQSLYDKLYLLLSQMCDHRILYVRLGALLSKVAFGEINYRFLMIFGAAHLLILPFIYHKVIKSIGLDTLFLLPIILLIFNIQPIENIFWAITSLQPNTVMVFGLWAFVLLLFTEKKLYFYFAIILCAVAMFTNGNGMFSFVAALPIVFYQRSRSERIVWLIATALCFFFYFFQFEKPGIRPDVGRNFTEFPHIILGDLFAFFGSPIDSTFQFYNIMLKHSVAIFTGVLLLGWLATLFFTFLYFRFTKNKANKNWFGITYSRLIKKPTYNLFLLSAFLFTGLSGAAFAAARASQGIEEAFSSRYKTVALILFTIIYLSGFSILDKKYWKSYFRGSVIVSFALALLSYYTTIDDTLNYRKFKASTMVNWTNNGRYFYFALGEKSRNPDDHAPITTYEKLPIPPFNYAGFVPGVMKYVNDILFISRTHYHNYTPPQEIIDFRNQLFNNQLIAEENLVKETTITKQGLVYAIEIKNAFVPAFAKYEGYYALVEGNAAKLCFPLSSNANKFSTFLTSGQYFNTTITGQVIEPDIPSGTFTLKVGKLQEGKFIIFQQRQIVVK